MPHTATNLLAHFIFSTKQRCALIKPNFEKDLHAYLGGIVRQIGGTALCVNGTRDHVHLLVRVPADHSVAEIARLIKTNSSRWVHGRWPEHERFAWQTGYGAFTVSESGAAAVRAYISHQQEHHRGEVVSRGVLGVFEEERNHRGRTLSLGLMVLSPLSGLSHLWRRYPHGLRRGLHSFRRYAAGPIPPKWAESPS